MPAVALDAVHKVLDHFFTDVSAQRRVVLEGNSKIAVITVGKMQLCTGKFNVKLLVQRVLFSLSFS